MELPCLLKDIQGLWFFYFLLVLHEALCQLYPSSWHVKPKIPSFPDPWEWLIQHRAPSVTLPLNVSNIIPPPSTVSFLFLPCSVSQGTIQHNLCGMSYCHVPSLGCLWPRIRPVSMTGSWNNNDPDSSHCEQCSVDPTVKPYPRKSTFIWCSLTWITQIMLLICKN